VKTFDFAMSSRRSGSAFGSRSTDSIHSNGVMPSAAALSAISRVRFVALPSFLPAPGRFPPTGIPDLP
jgi:hypothetical protein